MTVSNADVVRTLTEIADLLDLLGERFKPEAYRRAARSVEALPEDLRTIAGRGELRSIPGVGEAISEKVRELLETGSLAYLERLRAEVPAGVRELMRLPGVGPKTARRFWVELHVGGPDELAAAIAAGRLVGVRGFAEKKIDQLRSAAAAAAAGPAPARVPIEQAWPSARAIAVALRTVPSVREVTVAGSLRRCRETVGDLDVLATAGEPEAVFDAFSRLPQVQEVRLRGPTKETVVLRDGLQVDLRVVEPEAFGAALQYFTGSKDHNVRLRTLARERGLKVNEYGVYRGDDRVAGATEPDVYAALGLAWIPPELREDRGEIAAAASGKLPRLVEASDLVVEPHLHLPPSFPSGDLERLATDARARGVATVGVVVRELRGGASHAVVSPDLRERLRRGTLRGVRFAPVGEVVGDLAGADAAVVAAMDAEHLVLVPGGGPVRPPLAWRGPPVRLLAHLSGTGEAARPVLETARTLGAAVEIGPGAGRLDSTTARVARESGILLSVPTGVALAEDDPTAPVSLGFARRAGATKEDLLNARAPLARSGTRPGAGRTKGTVRSPGPRRR